MFPRSLILALRYRQVCDRTLSIFDVGLLYAIGGAGYVMRCWEIPLAPAVIGAILGPMAEQHLRRALAAAEGSWMVFVTRPISATVLMAALALALLPAIVPRWSGADSAGRTQPSG